METANFGGRDFEPFKPPLRPTITGFPANSRDILYANVVVGISRASDPDLVGSGVLSERNYSKSYLFEKKQDRINEKEIISDRKSS